VQSSAIEVRPCTEDDWSTIVRIDELAFGYTYEGDPTLASEMAVFELARTQLATLDGEAAGITSAYTMRMSVPGGEVPFAGVTWVGVVPTLRRRGVLRSLMAAQLADVHARGEPMAALFASQPGIYGRFGYGSASKQVTLTVRRGEGELDAPVDAGLSARIVRAPDALEEMAEVHDAVRAGRPGVPVRDKLWWERCIEDQPSQRAGSSELRALVVRDGAGARAYALFAGKHGFSEGFADDSVEVRESLSADAAASGRLWGTLLSMDLVGSVSVRRLPSDDALLHQLRDLRRARAQVRDGLYVRLVDLPAALVARTYLGSWSGVVDVADVHCPWNAGRWRLVLGPAGSAVERTDARPDVALDVRELGGAYLGGASLVARAAAGFVTQLTPRAVAALSAAMRHEPAPFCPTAF
jgi:predicted acetyltransferase